MLKAVAHGRVQLAELFYKRRSAFKSMTIAELLELSTVQT